jgi:hypothetical protein
MGILDDAIREHLELKRAHGASDDEVRRKESEVFGAPRREADAQEPPEAPQDEQIEAPHDEHTQLLTADEHVAAEEPSLADLEPLEPAPEDPYVVHPGDELVPDPDVPHVPEAHEPAPAAEAGAGTFEPSGTETGPPAPPVHHHDEQHPALVDHDHIGGEEHAPEPVFRHQAETPTAPPESPVEEPPADEPPIEEPAGDEDEDVHEETPEFLQDAPEHDRLWFEQKPPRDFDFGE